jgi:hypothetical protein
MMILRAFAAIRFDGVLRAPEWTLQQPVGGYTGAWSLRANNLLSRPLRMQ